MSAERLEYNAVLYVVISIDSEIVLLDFPCFFDIFVCIVELAHAEQGIRLQEIPVGEVVFLISSSKGMGEGEPTP